MDGTSYSVTVSEFKAFHSIDRALYCILVSNLMRNPSECLQIMGLWLWLERGGFWNAISKILALPPFLINELADEAVCCLNSINCLLPESLDESDEIPLTQSLVKRDISLQFFRENRFVAFHEIQNLVSETYIPALSDLLEKARHGGFGESSSSRAQMMSPVHVSVAQTRTLPPLSQSFSRMNIGDGSRSQDDNGRRDPNQRGNRSVARGVIDSSKYDRTMFVTFSKGYPVRESELRVFFTIIMGRCVESIYMQEVRNGEQSLYAKVVFFEPTFLDMVLIGVNKAKFTINGKHVWMRKFVPKY